MTGRPRWSGTVLLAIGLAALVSGPAVAIAQTDAPATYTVPLDLDLLQVLQGVATGGRDTGVEYDGLVKDLNPSGQLVNVGTPQWWAASACTCGSSHGPTRYLPRASA